MSNAKTSGLALAALILGIIGLCTILPAPVALILGIIALMKINGSQGQLKGQGLAIAGIVLGGVACLIIPVYAAIAIPNFIRYQLRSKQSEAKVSMMSIRTGAEAHRAEFDSYPQGDSGWVPSEPCGAQKCALDPSLWSQPPWSELRFTPFGDHYYQYRYSSDGSGYTIEAQADLDGDGTPGHLRMVNGSPDVEDLNASAF